MSFLVCRFLEMSEDVCRYMYVDICRFSKDAADHCVSSQTWIGNDECDQHTRCN
jgi:hypothetical protein